MSKKDDDNQVDISVSGVDNKKVEDSSGQNEHSASYLQPTNETKKQATPPKAKVPPKKQQQTELL